MTTLTLAFRTLLKMRSSALVVLLTLATGSAANLVVFAVVNAALIRPLSFSEPDRLVALGDRINGKSVGVSWAETEDLALAPVLFESAAAYTQRTWGLTDHTNSSLDVVLSAMVTPKFFRVIQPVPALGTAITSDNAPHAVVLSYALWQRRYHGDPNITTQSLSYALKISLGATIRHLVAEQLAQAVILAATASVLLRIASLRIGSEPSLDATALAANIGLMLLIATVVSLLPVRRALRISPIEALRAE